MINEIERRKKEVRAIKTEQRRLWQARRNLGSYELKKPIRHGWYKHLELRKDISRRKDAAIFQNIIDVAGANIWAREKKLADAKWSYMLNRENAHVEPGILKLDKRQFKKLMHKAKAHFERVEVRASWGFGTVKEFHCTVPHYYFVETYTKAYITHRKIIDAELERKSDELDALLFRPGYYGTDFHNWRLHRWFTKIEIKAKRRKVNMMLSNVDGSEEDDPIFPQIRNRSW